MTAAEFLILPFLLKRFSCLLTRMVQLKLPAVSESFVRRFTFQMDVLVALTVGV